MHLAWTRGGFTISTDPALLDRPLIHEFLRGSYWAGGIDRETVDRSIEGALCFGVYEGSVQVGFARVITDRATFAYLADVFVLEFDRPTVGGVEKFGFRRIEDPARCMEILDREVYARGGAR